jgi:hypothetical protein
MTTLAVTSSRPNLEILAAREVLAHPGMTFHHCTCGLHADAATIAAALIGYDNMKVTIGMTTRRRRSRLITSSTPTRNYVGLLLQLFFCCTERLVVTFHDLLLTSFLG